MAHRPAATVVFGDVDSTLACALAAAKLGVPVAHVEAGLRSFDRSMPEEINRIVTDALADLLLVSEPAGLGNLAREGVAPEKVRLVGNVMIDSLYAHLPAARLRPAAAARGVHGPAYGFVTLHRPANVDDADVLASLLQLFQRLARELPLIFAVHPRTAASASRFGLAAALRPGQHPWICVPAVSYLDSISLVAGATLVITDSGGLQEETAVLKVPCLTLRANTERPITVERGTSRLLAHDIPRIEAAVHDVLAGRWPAGQDIPLWDGQAGARVAGALAAWIGVEGGSRGAQQCPACS
jgi:UDP-N-acetylglucosamine 2-epimerase (non-hydrolysing)